MWSDASFQGSNSGQGGATYSTLLARLRLRRLTNGLLWVFYVGLLAGCVLSDN